MKVTAAAVEELEGLNAWFDTVSGAAGHCEQTSTRLHVLIVKATPVERTRPVDNPRFMWEHIR